MKNNYFTRAVYYIDMNCFLDVRARCEAALSRLDTIRPRERPKFRSEARDVESL